MGLHHPADVHDGSATAIRDDRQQVLDAAYAAHPERFTPTPTAVTHIATWDDLVALTGNVDFLYVADSKLATFDNARHIHTRGGRFLSVLSRSRREDRIFGDWIVANTPAWTEAMRLPSREPDTDDDVLCTYTDHLPSADGHRIVWIHSTAKARRDATRRHQRIAKTITGLDALNTRLASPRCRIKTAATARPRPAGSSTSMPPAAGSVSMSNSRSSSRCDRPNGAAPAPRPPTRRSPAPCCASGSRSTRPASLTTPPRMGCGR